MADQILVCQNCNSEFLFAEGEQKFYLEKKLEVPRFCPICRSILTQQKTKPAKPLSTQISPSDPSPKDHDKI